MTILFLLLLISMPQMSQARQERHSKSTYKPYWVTIPTPQLTADQLKAELAADREKALETNDGKTGLADQPEGVPEFGRHLYVTKSEMERLDRHVVASYPDVKPAAFLKKAFGIYLKARLANLTKRKRQRIHEILKNIKHVRTTADNGEMNWASYDIKTDVLSIDPMFKPDSLIYYVLLVHELEHAIQPLLKTVFWGLVKNQFNSASDMTYFLYYIYHQEIEAVRAEYDFLRLMPNDHGVAGIKAAYTDADQEQMRLRARSGNFLEFHANSRYKSLDIIKRHFCNGRC